MSHHCVLKVSLALYGLPTPCDAGLVNLACEICWITAVFAYIIQPFAAQAFLR